MKALYYILLFLVTAPFVYSFRLIQKIPYKRVIVHGMILLFLFMFPSNIIKHILVCVYAFLFVASFVKIEVKADFT